MAEPGYLTATISTCAVCGRLIPARVHLERDGVYFHKICPEHGAQSPRVYSDPDYYLNLFRYHRAASIPLAFATQAKDTCPHNCGMCPEHEQHLCMPILEITDQCDMACPICLVRPRGSYHWSPEQVAGILDRLIEAEGRIDVLNLSGGEPTVHPDFRAIVEECLGRREILCVSVSTNGRRLARDPELLRFLIERRVVISLQFDGEDAAANRAMRGVDDAAQKRRLIEFGGEQGARMSLTLTMARGFNDQAAVRQAADILFAHDHLLSLMVQPMAYVGVGAGMTRPDNPITISDVLQALDGAAGGQVHREDFSPLPCSHPACFSLAFYLRTHEKKFLPIKQLIQGDRYLDMIQNRTLFGMDAQSFRHVQSAIYDLWSGPAGVAPDSQRALRAVREILTSVGRACCPAAALAQAQNSIKSIFIHQFMDRHNFDLSRARKCCQFYPQFDGRIIPACVHNCLRRS